MCRSPFVALVAAGLLSTGLVAAPAVVRPLSAQPAPASADVRDLPLVEVAAPPPTTTTGSAAQRSPTERSLAVLLTGDGDWAAIDKGIASAVVGGGIPVVGLKARAYLEQTRRTPDDLARDVERIARAYMPRWNRDRLVLLGYSRGAEWIPFVVNRLPAELRDRVTLVGMYGADPYASFVFHFVDLFSDKHRDTDIAVGPEFARMLALRPAVRTFCVYGTDEKSSSCATAPDSPSLRKIARGGAHHFDKDYPGLGRIVLEELGR